MGSRSAPVAQLDRALPSEGRGQRFESSRVRHFRADAKAPVGIIAGAPPTMTSVGAMGAIKNVKFLALGLAIGVAAGIASGELLICISAGLVLGYAIGEARKNKAVQGNDRHS